MVGLSRCPMAIAEVAEAITVGFDLEDGPVFLSTRWYTDPRDVLVRCSSLVSESEGKHYWFNPMFQPLLIVKTGTIKLSHFSVKEYLLSSHVEKDFSIEEKTSHLKISKISVAYLLQFESFAPLTKAIVDTSLLAQYAAQHCIDHTESGGMDPTLLKLILELFTSETAVFTNWIRIWDIDCPWSRQDLQRRGVKFHLLFIMHH